MIVDVGCVVQMCRRVFLCSWCIIVCLCRVRASRIESVVCPIVHVWSPWIREERFCVQVSAGTETQGVDQSVAIAHVIQEG
jgi:hypothetical protein